MVQAVARMSRDLPAVRGAEFLSVHLKPARTAQANSDYSGWARRFSSS